MIECTPKYLDQQLTTLDLQNVELARIADVAPASVQRWLNGSSPVPRSIIVMLELMICIKRGHDLTQPGKISMIWAEPPQIQNLASRKA